MTTQTTAPTDTADPTTPDTGARLATIGVTVGPIAGRLDETAALGLAVPWLAAATATRVFRRVTITGS